MWFLSIALFKLEHLKYVNITKNKLQHTRDAVTRIVSFCSNIDAYIDTAFYTLSNSCVPTTQVCKSDYQYNATTLKKTKN